MKRSVGILLCMMLLAVVAALPVRSQETQTVALLNPGPALGSSDEISDFPDTQQYAQGKQAIREGRWGDAVSIFGDIAKQGGVHAASALYWKAYALNKSGKTDDAIHSCEELVKEFSASSWIEDCGALQIEIHASRGTPQAPKPEQSDELKLLALASLLQKDPAEATAQIRELVQGDASERLKEGAVFILGQQVPEATYPQIVRISYLEGDVRVARANEEQNFNKPEWNDAVMNLPLHTGDSLATGKDGRVEIEFEDASTVYLAENSVLNFVDLHATAQVPHTEIALVSGTLTTHLDSLVGGETFLLRTPTENLLTRYPQRWDMRITSYLDGIAVTSLKGGALDVTGADRLAMSAGKTVFFRDGHMQPALAGAKGADFAEFDAWVADRYGARTATMQAMMKDAGLSRPVPGLAEMKGKGHFFPCPPYGTCWQPDEAQANAVLTSGPAPAPTPKTARPSAGGPTNGAPGGAMAAAWWFPCLDGWYLGMWGSSYAYTWGVCHSGDWIPYNNTYAWVPDGRRHHQAPVRWVRFGDRVGLVPLHPRDTKGKPAMNREYGLVPVKGKDGVRLTPVKLDGKPLHPVKSAPREFRHPVEPVLTRVAAPRMLAHALEENAKAGIPASRSLALNFSLNQGFTTPRQVEHGGRVKTVTVPVGRAGSGMWASGVARGGTVGFGALGGARATSAFRGGSSTGSAYSNSFNTGHSGTSSFSGGGSSGGSYVAPVSAPAASGGPVASPSPAPK